MDNIKKYLTVAKITREKFLQFWKQKDRDTTHLIKFLDYPFELQLGIILEFLHEQKIHIFLYRETFDLLLIEKPINIPDIVLVEKHGLWFITYDQKLQSNNIMQQYLVACVAAINWLNFK